MDEHRRTAALGWIRQPRPVELVGGSAVVRGAVPADADGVADMHLRCSMDSVFRRYFTGVPRLSRSWQLALLSTEVAIVAVSPGLDHSAENRVVALGNLSVLPAGGLEAALLVEDAFQGRGLGSAMMRQLGAAAWLLGHRTLQAETLATSTAVHRMLARLGPHTVTPAPPGGLATFTLQLGFASLTGLGDPRVPVRRAG